MSIFNQASKAKVTPGWNYIKAVGLTLEYGNDFDNEFVMVPIN